MKNVIIIGCGSRGAKSYGMYAVHNPHEMKVVGIADPNKDKQAKFQALFNLEDHQVYDSYEDILAEGKIADAAIIATLDRMHYAPAIQALEIGYDILLEKPISPDAKECVEIAEVANRNNRSVTVCHVLRYTDFWSKIKQVVSDGVIGDVASIQLNENVEYMHMSHSFVRGNWGNSDESSPMILQKSCHDMDIISYIIDKKCERVSSYGSLLHFNENYKPEGAPKRCLEGCPVADSCMYHAGNYYLGHGRGWAGAFVNDVNNNDEIIDALWNTDYGKCVYQSDNNVVDHQVVNMEFEDGVTATFSMCGFTREQTRIVQIMGTKGEIRGNMSDNSISIYDFQTREETVVKFPVPTSGHGGGDDRIMKQFLSHIDKSDTSSLSSIDQSLQSHLMAFAAEESRLNSGHSVELDAFQQAALN